MPEYGNHRYDGSQYSLLFCLYYFQSAVRKHVAGIIIAHDRFFIDSHPSKELTEAVMHGGMTKVAEWSGHHNLILSVNKCKISIFTKNLKGARWEPSLQPTGSLFHATALPKFLGVPP